MHQLARPCALGTSSRFACHNSSTNDKREALFEGIDLRALGYRTTEHVPTQRATHVVVTR